MTSVATRPPQRKFALLKSGTALLKSSVRELLVQKFISGETSVLKNLGFQCRSVEELKVEKYDDGLLLLLREELQKPSPAPNTSLRAALLKARFSDTITANDAAASTSENSMKRKRADEILESERKRRREEDELKSIQRRLENEKEEQKRRQKNADTRATARAKLDTVKKVEVIWPEENFWAMRQFDLLIRGGC